MVSGRRLELLSIALQDDAIDLRRRAPARGGWAATSSPLQHLLEHGGGVGARRPAAAPVSMNSSDARPGCRCSSAGRPASPRPARATGTRATPKTVSVTGTGATKLITLTSSSAPTSTFFGGEVVVDDADLLPLEQRLADLGDDLLGAVERQRPGRGRPRWSSGWPSHELADDEQPAVGRPCRSRAIAARRGLCARWSCLSSRCARSTAAGVGSDRAA